MAEKNTTTLFSISLFDMLSGISVISVLFHHPYCLAFLFFFFTFKRNHPFVNLRDFVSKTHIAYFLIFDNAFDIQELLC